jgi:ABC-type transport system substrate-binding protein
MKKIAFVLTVILATFIAFGLVTTVFADSGPRTPKMLIRIYANPDPENRDLESGVLDLNDWPLTKDWIDKWALLPDDLVLDGYVELGMMEIDMFNQKWPTGDSNNRFYNASIQQSVKSVEFRKAVTMLLDRNKIVSDIMKGQGIKMYVPLPPSQSAYYDMTNYTASGYVYDFDEVRANQTLWDAGFTLLPGHTWRQDPLLAPGVDMAPITFYIRQDDPMRLGAGNLLADALVKMGIPVNRIITEKTVCYKNVMVNYDYHLYTGGWSLSSIPDQYYDLYSSYTYYGPTIGWSQNYPGFCNAEFDAWASKVKYPATEDEAQTAAKTAGYLFLKYCAMAPMYCTQAVKAYKKGWSGVVNNGGFGIDNYWSFLNMEKTGDDTIDWGFKSNIEQLNQVSSEWLWDQNVLGLTYEGLLGTNPFNLAPTEFFIASNKSIAGSWNATSVGGDEDATYINFTIRDNVYWHNNDTQGDPLTVDDVSFSFYFQKACGKGIAWSYPSLTTFNKTVTYPTTEPNKIGIYYTKKSAWAVQWAGGLPILRKAIWNILWTNVTGWQMSVKTYDPSKQNINNNDLNDLYEDGTGAWIYNSYVQDEYVTLIANTYYYINQTTISTRLAEMFHAGAGDVNSDGYVYTDDLGKMARAMLTDLSDTPYNGGWGKYSYQCDLNGDGNVDGKDMILVTAHYGQSMG